MISLAWFEVEFCWIFICWIAKGSYYAATTDKYLLLQYHSLESYPIINHLINTYLSFFNNAPAGDVFFYGFSCDQAAIWLVQSIRLSVRLSVHPSVCPSHLFHHVPIIMSSWNFRELLPMTKVTSMQKAKVRGQRSRSQRSTPNLTVSGL